MTDAVLTIASGRVEGPRGTVLEDVDLTIREGAVTALLGPSGSGKSALLRAMSGEPPAPGWRNGGTFTLRGHPLSHETGDPPSRLSKVAWLPQDRYRAPHPGESFARPPAVQAWRDALVDGPDLVLLDEPDRGEDVELDALCEALSWRPTTQAVVMITHNLELVRKVADEVAFACAGTLRYQLPADEFFEAPPDNTAARFVKMGNTWPSTFPEAPSLPSHFCWIIPDELAGMGKPGLLRDVDEDLASIAHAGVTHLVTLTEERLPTEIARAHGITNIHFPIRDMGVPAIGDAARLCGQLERLIGNGKTVAFHCHAGLGRTGTLLAAMLIWTGTSADDAVTRVRQGRARYIQSKAQQAFLRELADRYGPKR